ncbi:RIFT barrel domain-containing protein, partial [Hydrogenophaga intermedia]
MLTTLLAATCLVAACGGGGGGGGLVSDTPSQVSSDSAPTPLPAAPVGPGGLACASGAITCVEVTSGSAQSNVPITFGQPFRVGDLSTSQGLRAQDSAGNTVPLQMDEVSTQPNGSVRFAVLSASVPSLPANSARIINIYPAAKTTPNVSLPAAPAWNLQITARLSDGTTLTANPQAQLQQQIANGSGRRLHGPVASEFNVVSPLNDRLTARLHVRLYKTGQIRT